MKKLLAATAIALVAGMAVAFRVVPGSAGVGLPALSPAPDDVRLAAHKSVYDFRMIGIGSGTSGISDIRGSMYYEQGDACEAWTTDHRFTSDYYAPERPPIRHVSQYVAWESKDGQQFQFSSERQEGADQESEKLRGAVERNAEGNTTAQYSRPPELTFDLPQGYYLPAAHTVEIIRRARKGERFFNAKLFDGTDAEGPVEVNVFIGKKIADEERAAILKDKKTIDAQLLAAPAWHVRMAVFPLKGGAGVDSSVPSYEMDVILHDNGVISDAVVDYKNFKVGQRLTALEPLPATSCE